MILARLKDRVLLDAPMPIITPRIMLRPSALDVRWS